MAPPHENPGVSFWKSCRFRLAIVGFFAYFHVYVVRINMSVAIVCMTSPIIHSSVNGSITENNSTECINNSNHENFILNSTCMSTDTGNSTPGVPHKAGTFDWERQLQGYILSSFFYGYLVTQLLGGWLAGALGSKHVLGTGLLLAGISTLLVPVLANTHYGLLIAQRVFLGMATGVAYPAGHALWGKWAPPLERSKLVTVCYAGAAVGSTVITALAGVLCDYGFAGGWPSIFYVSGMSTIVAWIFWVCFAHSSPAKHPRISVEERCYIETSIGHTKEHVHHIPWRAILTSPPVFAILVCHFCSNYGLYTFITGIPMYMNDVLKLPMSKGGVLAAMPAILATLGAVLVAVLVDHLRKKGFWSTGAARKWMQGLGTFPGAICMIITSFLDHRHKPAVMVLMVIFGICSSTRPSSFNVNHVDIAPRYAGVLYGISNTLGTVSGMIAPIVIGQLTPNRTREEWQIVLVIVAVIMSLGAIFFILFASGEEQEWAKDTEQCETAYSYVTDKDDVEPSKKCNGLADVS